MKTKIQLIKWAIAVMGLCAQNSFSQQPETAVQNGVQWLLSMQNPDGGWAGQDYLTNSDYYITVWCLYALMAGGLQAADPPCQNAYQYVLTQQEPNGSWRNDVYATVLGMLAKQAYQQDFTLAKQWIVGLLQTDGSFSAGSVEEKNYATTWAMMGLMLTGTEITDPLIQNGKTFLLQHQNADGSFAGPWNPAIPTSETLYVLTLTGMTLTDAAVANGLAFIRSAQHPDGGWGPIISSHPGDAGVGLANLLAIGLPVSDVTVQNAINCLLSKQNSDGSWPDPWASTRAQCQSNRAIVGLAVACGQPAPFGKIMKLFKREPLPAAVDLQPNTLNPKSAGQHLTGYIELPMDYDVNDIDLSTVKITRIGTKTVEIFAQSNHGEIGDHDGDLVPDYMVKFSRAEILAALDMQKGEIEFAVEGKIGEDDFAGMAVVRALTKLEKMILADDNVMTPKEYGLLQNFPNPFNACTRIVFIVAKESKAAIAIFNTKGQMVKNLAKAVYAPGSHAVHWDGTNEWGAPVVSGNYFVRMTGDYNDVMVLSLLR